MPPAAVVAVASAAAAVAGTNAVIDTVAIAKQAALFVLAVNQRSFNDRTESVAIDSIPLPAEACAKPNRTGHCNCECSATA